jgi:hypothetical protein
VIAVREDQEIFRAALPPGEYLIGREALHVRLAKSRACFPMRA